MICFTWLLDLFLLLTFFCHLLNLYLGVTLTDKKKIHSTLHWILYLFTDLFCVNHVTHGAHTTCPFLQPVNDDPLSAFIKTRRYGKRSIIWAFFHEGKKKNDMICKLCPNGKVVRIHKKKNWNLQLHLRRSHEDELKSFTEKRLLEITSNC